MSFQGTLCTAHFGQNLKCMSGRALSQSFRAGCLSVVGSSWLQCFSTASLNAMGPDSGTQAQHEWDRGWRESDVPPQHRPGKLAGVRGATTAIRGAFSRYPSPASFPVVTGSAGNLSAADCGCVCPLFTWTLPLWRSALQGCGVSLVA